MEVTIKFLSPLRSRSGKDEERIECSPGTNVRNFFQIMGEKFGQEFSQQFVEKDSGKIRSGRAVCLKREGQQGYQRLELFEGMDTELQAHDSLIVFHPMCGG